MKTTHIFSIKTMAAALLMAFAPLAAAAQQTHTVTKTYTVVYDDNNDNAQPQGYNRLHFGIDWQMNAPVINHYTKGLAGWGMNFEGSYNITPRWDAGLFVGFSTNHKYLERQTINLSPTENITTDRQRSAFQLPFGLTTSYTLTGGRCVRPYIGAKVGTEYMRATTYFADRYNQDEKWGFYVSPEIGLRIYPCGTRFGFKVAGYFSYATNHPQTFDADISPVSNVGFRVGVLF